MLSCEDSFYRGITPATLTTYEGKITHVFLELGFLVFRHPQMSLSTGCTGMEALASDVYFQSEEVCWTLSLSLEQTHSVLNINPFLYRRKIGTPLSILVLSVQSEKNNALKNSPDTWWIWWKNMVFCVSFGCWISWFVKTTGADVPCPPKASKYVPPVNLLWCLAREAAVE